MRYFILLFYVFLFVNGYPASALSETDSKEAIERKLREIKNNQNNLSSKAEKGDADAQYKLGLLYLHEDFNGDRNGEYFDGFKEGKSLLESAGKKGHVKALYVSYMVGKASGSRDEENLKWLRESSDADYVPALHQMGLYYHYKGATPDGYFPDEQDNRRAADFFKRAVLKGSLRSQARLAYLYSKGLGVRKDIDRAYILYLDAAQRGLYRAYSRIALDWHDRGGIDPNQEKFDEYWWKYKNNEDREPFCGEDEQGRDYVCNQNDGPPSIVYQFFLNFEDYI